MQSKFATSSVLFKWTYVTPVQAVKRIERMKMTCRDAPYLDCVVEYAEVSKITADFSRLHKVPELADPDTFVEYYEAFKDDDNLTK
jgi:hypothetical protein